MGTIEYLDPATKDTFGLNDGFTHLPEKIPLVQQRVRTSQLREAPTQPLRGLRKENTRHLLEIGKEALIRLKEHISERPLRALLLGAGAGVEAADVKNILPDCEITTNALTPMSPLYDLCHDFESMRRMLWEAIKIQGSKQDRIDFSWMREALSMNPNFAFKMNRELGMKIFRETSDHASTQVKQLIGDLTLLSKKLDEIPPQDLIYEQYGPLEKILDGRPSEATLQALEKILQALLTEESLLVVGAATKDVRRNLRALLPKFSFEKESFRWVGFHRDGPHARDYAGYRTRVRDSQERQSA